MPAIALLALGVLGGCSGAADRPEVAPVQGHVSYKGQPVAGVTVTFICEGAPRFASGTTDLQGNYTLTTYEPGDGAVVGQNVVTVSVPPTPPADTAADSPLTGEYYNTLEASQKAAAKDRRVPARYADAKTSGLAFEVTDGPNQHNLPLTD